MALRICAFLLLICTSVPYAAAEPAAKIVSRLQEQTSNGAITLEQMVSKLLSEAGSAETKADSRSLYALAGEIQEQLGQYAAAVQSYTNAAAAGDTDAAGMRQVSSQQLALDAARCALSQGDSAQADAFLSSSLKNSPNPEIAACARLYEVWSMLCRASDETSLHKPIALLESYASLDSMETVRPAALLTLFHITGEPKWSAQLQNEYPNAPETALAQGKISIMPAPFWYFVPRTDAALAQQRQSPAGHSPETEQNNGEKPQTGGGEKIAAQQLGFFRSSQNAQGLVKRLAEKGFDAAVHEEKRSSGTVYYVVTVKENSEGTMGIRLKDAGFECYPVFE